MTCSRVYRNYEMCTAGFPEHCLFSHKTPLLQRMLRSNGAIRCLCVPLWGVLALECECFPRVRDGLFFFCIVSTPSATSTMTSHLIVLAPLLCTVRKQTGVLYNKKVPLRSCPFVRAICYWPGVLAVSTSNITTVCELFFKNCSRGLRRFCEYGP